MNNPTKLCSRDYDAPCSNDFRISLSMIYGRRSSIALKAILSQSDICFAGHRYTMRIFLKLNILFGSFGFSYGSEVNKAFYESIIETWQLRSPTILVKDDLPKMCMNHFWLLCLTNDQNTSELANHLALIHQQRKQDGLIFVGSQGHEQILEHLYEQTSSILSSDYPVFMPISYQNDIPLRLDSHILFYRDNEVAKNKIYDIFAVKAGPSIALEVGEWKAVWC